MKKQINNNNTHVLQNDEEAVDGFDESVESESPPVADAPCTPATAEADASDRADTLAETDQVQESAEQAPEAPTEADTIIVSADPEPFDVNHPKQLDRATFPDTLATVGENGRLPATIPNLKHMLTSYGITAGYNVIDKSMQINIPSLAGCPDNADNTAITHIVSLASFNGLPNGLTPSYLEAIANEHQLNPVMDYIQSRPWDGEKRIDALADTLVTGPDFPLVLKKVLLRKWLVSAVAAVAMPSGFRSRGVLSLQGPQSIGKTSWILRLIDDPHVRSETIKIDHHLDTGNKDSVLTATSHWIVEIGELDSSFKKDIARLKGFITGDQDKVRRPYARKDSVYPRRTVFIATVNHANFLVDDTGNSRWWTIPVISINYDHDIDMQQVWAQVYALFQDGHEWWLTPEEEKLLEQQNAKHQSVNSIHDLVYTALDTSVPAADRKSMSASELLRKLDINNPTNTQSRDCGGALRTLLGEPRVSQGVGRWMVPLKRAQGFDSI